MESEAKFTKGPWWRSDSGGVCIGEHVGDFRPNRIFCDVRANAGVVTAEEIKANECIISAAPELYEALERVLPSLDYKRTHSQTTVGSKNAAADIEAVKKALAKARGEDSE